MKTSAGAVWVVGILAACASIGCQQDIASSGFNDVSGLNGDGVANDAPFDTGDVSLGGQGGGEPGWAGAWFMSTGSAKVGTVAYEGDGAAAFFQNTAAADRKLSEAQAEQFQIEVRVMIPSTITTDVIFRVYDSGIPNIVQAIAVQWAVYPDKSFRVLDGIGDTTGTMEDTGFKLTPGTWHSVTTVVDPASKTWIFAVDGQQYNAPDPLGFRGAPVNIDSIQFLNEIASPNGSYLDDVVITKKTQASQALKLGSTATKRLFSR